MLRESLLTNACIRLVLQYFFSSSLCMLCMVQLLCFCTFLAVLIQLLVYFLYPCLMQGSKNVALFVFLGVKYAVCQCKISTSILKLLAHPSQTPSMLATHSIY